MEKDERKPKKKVNENKKLNDDDDDENSDSENELRKKLKKKRNKIKDISLEVEDLNQKLFQTKQDNSDLKAELKELRNYKNKYDQLKLKYREVKSERKKLLQEAEKKQEEEEKKEEIIKTNKKPAKYDVVINIDSLLNCNEEGWEVDYFNQEKSQEFCLKDQVAIGVIGRENTGKTFIINKISKENFASSYYANTKGLSLKYFNEPNKQLKVFLDSAGLNAGVFL